MQAIQTSLSLATQLSRLTDSILEEFGKPPFGERSTHKDICSFASNPDGSSIPASGKEFTVRRVKLGEYRILSNSTLGDGTIGYQDHACNLYFQRNGSTWTLRSTAEFNAGIAALTEFREIISEVSKIPRPKRDNDTLILPREIEALEKRRIDLLSRELRADPMGDNERRELTVIQDVLDSYAYIRKIDGFHHDFTESGMALERSRLALPQPRGFKFTYMPSTKG